MSDKPTAREMALYHALTAALIRLEHTSRDSESRYEMQDYRDALNKAFYPIDHTKLSRAGFFDGDES